MNYIRAKTLRHLNQLSHVPRHGIPEWSTTHLKNKRPRSWRITRTPALPAGSSLFLVSLPEGLIIRECVTSMRRGDVLFLTAPSGLILDIRAQTKAVLEKLSVGLDNIQHQRDSPSGRRVIEDLTVFLVDIKDNGAFNEVRVLEEVYNAFFDAETGPSRATVAVKELPSLSLTILFRNIPAQASDRNQGHCACLLMSALAAMWK
ncbi:hypothetical protein BC937DRAFT_89380 [Endogone sp. FLAS-F59071]|nr:hypothetical protein BC937DRAFT_89380 [Endogone sp. FLAS-F59071]|eukprot:RUS17886.1 hypothetical protein BC937DRAFT_89380 [Endogone sp. FLAS-F59071]